MLTCLERYCPTKFFHSRSRSFSKDTACLAEYSEPCSRNPGAELREFSLRPQHQAGHPEAGIFNAVQLRKDCSIPTWAGRSLDRARFKAEEGRVPGTVPGKGHRQSHVRHIQVGPECGAGGNSPTGPHSDGGPRAPPGKRQGPCSVT